MTTTPYILYDLAKIEKNYITLKSLFPEANVFYAVKANKIPEVLQTLRKAGCGFEVNTKIELDAVLNTGEQANMVINSSPVKKVEEIQYMFDKGVNRFAFDCKDEIEKLQQYAPNCNVYLRIHTNNHGSGQELNTKTGVPLDEAPELLSLAERAKLNPFGITFTVGSQCNNLHNWEDAIKKAAILFEQFESLNTIDLGGGIPISYEHTVLNPRDIIKTIENSIKKYFKKKPKIYMEPGRFLTGNSGTTVTTIIGVRELKSSNWLFVDASVFGAFLELLEFKPADLTYQIKTDKTEKPSVIYNIAGPTCDGCDIIRRNILLPKMSRGNKLYFLNTGAYTLEYASPFNGFEIPKYLFT